MMASRSESKRSLQPHFPSKSSHSVCIARPTQPDTASPPSADLFGGLPDNLAVPRLRTQDEP